MKPIKFDYANITFAKNQPGYMPLPAWTDGSQVVSGWSLTWRERLHLLRTGILWVRQMTFGQPLQPLRPQSLSPFPTMPIVQNDNAHKIIATDPGVSAQPKEPLPPDAIPSQKRLEPMEE